MVGSSWKNDESGGLAPTVSLAAIYRGVMPYIASNLVRLALLLSVPALCLWLPAVMKD